MLRLGQSDVICLVLWENLKICFPSGHVSTPTCAGVSQQKQKLHVVNTESTIWWAAGLDNTQLGTGFGTKNSQDEHQVRFIKELRSPGLASPRQQVAASGRRLRKKPVVWFSKARFCLQTDGA